MAVQNLPHKPRAAKTVACRHVETKQAEEEERQHVSQ
jgi:hypothetical protein